MKIKEFAEEIGITQGAIYKAILRAGYSTKKLTDKRGEITSAGMRILRRIYPENAPETVSDAPEETEADNSTFDELRDRLREAESRRDALDAELKSVRDQLTEARDQAQKWEKLYLEEREQARIIRETAAEEKRRADILLSQAQENYRILAMNPIKRLFSGRKKAQSVETDGEIK